MTGQAIDFIEKMTQQGEGPWLCHLSYIKPHWPYIVPAPYHGMYGKEAILPVVRDAREHDNPHPVYEQFMNNAIGRAFRRDEVRESVIPAYMGLIKQCDDQFGRLLKYLDKSGRMQDTMIVVTADHGDYLGDHWLGEKDLFHDPAVKVPCLVYDPSPYADATRGTVCDDLVESIDLTATFIEFAGGEVPEHIVEGRSLVPFLKGEQPESWRDFAVSEYDYSITPMAKHLGVASKDARLFMLVDKRWKFIHAEGGFRPMLFDLEADPDELNDIGADLEHQVVLDLMYERLGQWARRLSQRVTRSEADLDKMRGASLRKGILLGHFDGSESSADLQAKYLGPARQNYLGVPGDARSD
jgi:arylsulfatase A-like enzyme